MLSGETIILGDDFIKESNFDIFIDGEKIKYSKIYQFEKIKKYNVQFKLYENINMDYMFRNISSLNNVELISNKNAKILSIISTFEDCTKLETFKISGFITNEINSLEKLFYKSSLVSINLENFDTSNVKDMSYMFAQTQIEELNITNFETKRVESMAYMFYQCSSLYLINMPLETN